jgi:hypothetical protein
MATRSGDVTQEIERLASQVQRELFEHLDDRGKLAVIQAPPGSGKTYLLLKAVEHAWKRKLRIAIATQTNSQANDICERIARDYPALCATRFAGQGSAELDLGRNITWATRKDQLPAGRCIVIGTAAKWGLITIEDEFDVLFVEEAWQLSWADCMLLGQVAPRFVLIGDPGQIPPVVTIDVARWETSPRPPHMAAPEVILTDKALRPEQWSLPASRRLPHDAVGLVKRFYNFDFAAFAKPGERQVVLEKAGRKGEDRALDLLGEGSVVGVTVPTPDEGPLLSDDPAVADAAISVVKRLFNRNAKFRIDGRFQSLKPEHVGLCATHRTMNATLELGLPSELRGRVVVDTPERWQGLERPVMVIVHPLSGVIYPSAFDLETGRLCVMASRHQAGLVIVGRDHIGETLEHHIPSADQPVGKPDVTGRGHWDNLHFWSALQGNGRLVSCT